MRRRAFVFAVVLASGLAGGGRAAAQPTTTAVSSDELVTQALAEHPELLAMRAEVDAAAGRVQQAGLRPNPMLDLGFQKALGPDNNTTVGVSLPLDLNGRKEGRVGVAERELEVRRAQIAERERRLRADVRAKAGEFLAARRTLATVGELLAANRRALTVVQARVRGGAAPDLDESLQLLEVNRMEASEVALGGRLDVLGLQLRMVAGLPAGPPVAIRGELAVASLPDIDQATRDAVRVRPDAVSARAEAAMAAARVRKEEAEGRWDASVNVGYQRQDFGFDLMGVTASGATRPIQDVFHYFGAGVSITLPVRNRNQGNVAAARAELRAAERRQELVDRLIRQEIAAAVAQDAAARRALDLYARGVRAVAARNLEVMRQAYELGRGTLLDVVGEQRRYLEVENGYTDALKQVDDAGVELARATSSW
jgi:cobalt-zinc-cadmium efflux system outer membrane protein